VTPPRIGLIDCKDSFTYNLAAYIRDCGGDVTVISSDDITTVHPDIFDKLLLSPGPGLPDEIQGLTELIRSCALRKPILGVCLGMQAIVMAFGGKLEKVPVIYHGTATDIRVLEEDNYLFQGLPDVFSGGRYHSWCASRDFLPDILRVTCVAQDGVIMGVRHKDADIQGIQFHPESIMTPDGKHMIRNWVQHN
jgi:anthranilate synthase component 2